MLSAIKAARLAGRAIMEIYEKPFEVYLKDDASPVTQADLRASEIIKETLQPTGLPFVSEVYKIYEISRAERAGENRRLTEKKTTMDNPFPEIQRFCQSCGMPLSDEVVSDNPEYC